MCHSSLCFLNLISLTAFQFFIKLKNSDGLLQSGKLKPETPEFMKKNYVANQTCTKTNFFGIVVQTCAHANVLEPKCINANVLFYLFVPKRYPFPLF